ncbi:MAG: hypothetical protein JW384_01234 [Nitrosomonadaceae bacterium]|nr:hypothetical protein [Nitrosomonadaceae bacterium]
MHRVSANGFWVGFSNALTNILTLGTLLAGLTQLGVARLENRALDRVPGAVGFLLSEGMEIIEAANEQQIGDLFDHLQRVRYATRPERIPDPVDFAL